MYSLNCSSEAYSEVEVVERKGLGHPDTLADAIAEKASALYSQYFYERFEGRFAHHWFDKVVLIGGESRIEYGIGEIVKPYEVIFIGKGVKRVGDILIPTTDIFRKAAETVLSDCLTGFDATKHLKVVNRVSDYRGPGQKSVRYRPDSERDLFKIGEGDSTSNDCNLCIGYWPLSSLENLVLQTELYLNSANFKSEMGGISGSDIKLVGERVGDRFRLLVNFPFLAQHIHSWSMYLSKVQVVEEHILRFVRREFGISLEKLVVNPEKEKNRPYLTVLGSVADTGDIGVVGRGNRINGLITPTRPMSIEAWAGKNPIDHTGKLHTLVAAELSRKVYERTGIANQVILTSSKETPIDKPDLLSISLFCDEPTLQDWKSKIDDLVNCQLSEIQSLTMKCVFGESIDPLPMQIAV